MAVLLALLKPLSAFASGFHYTTFHPVTDSTSYLGVWSPKTLDLLEWEAGTSLHFEHHPFQLYQGGTRVRGVIDDIVTQHLTGSLGLVSRWLEVGVDLPVAWRFSFQNPNVATPTQEGKTRLADMQFYLKSQLFNTRSQWLQIGLLSNISAPTGSVDHFLGDHTAVFTESLLLESAPLERFSLALNLGFEFRPTLVFRDINKSDQFKIGFGMKYDLCPRLQLLAELESQTRLSDPYGNKANAPTEVLAGIKYLIKDSGFVLTSGLGGGMIHGSGAPLIRVFIGLSYAPSFKKKPGAE